MDVVLPIGGLKEKALAAQRAGVTRIIAPKRNQTDLAELPPNLLKDVEFVFVDNVDRVFREALEVESGNGPARPGRGSARRKG